MKTSGRHYDVPAMLANCRQYWVNYSPNTQAAGPVTVYRTGVPHPLLNGVLQLKPGAKDVIPDVVSQLAKMPSAWWVGADSYPAATQDVLDAGGKLIAKVPVMAIHLRELSSKVEMPANCTLELLDETDDLSAWVQCYCEPMGVSEKDFAAMLLAERSRRDAPGQLLRFAARADGQIVGTSELFIHEGVAGVYLVATKKSHRRLGIGTALTHAACMAGLGRGLDVATLQASSSGYPVYKKLGFDDVTAYDMLSFSKA